MKETNLEELVEQCAAQAVSGRVSAYRALIQKCTGPGEVETIKWSDYSSEEDTRKTFCNIKADIGNDSDDVSYEASGACGCLLANDSFVSMLQVEDQKEILDYIIKVIKEKKGKKMFVRMLWCIARSKLNRDVYKEKSAAILETIVDILKCETSSASALEALQILHTLLQVISEVMGLEAKIWYPSVFKYLFHEAYRVRSVACVITYSLKTQLEDSSDLSATKSFVLSSMVNELQSKYCKKMRELVAKDNGDVLKIWRLIVQLLGKLLHMGTSLINDLLEVVEKGFKNNSPEIRIEAFKCWRTLMDNFSLDDSVLTHHKRLKLLLAPLKANNAKTEEIAYEKLIVWWHLVYKLKDKAAAHFDLVVTPLLKFCFCGSLSSSPGGQGAGLAQRNFMMSVPGASPGRRFAGLHMLCAEILAQILSVGAGITPRQHFIFGISCLEKPLINIPLFIRTHQLLIACASEALQSLTDENSKRKTRQNALGNLIIESVISRMQDIIVSEGNKKESVEQVKVLFTMFSEMQHHCTPGDDLSNFVFRFYELITTGEEFALPLAVINSRHYHISTGNTMQDMMSGTLSSHIVQQLCKPSMLYLAATREEYFTVWNTVLENSKPSTGKLGFFQSVVKDLDGAEVVLYPKHPDTLRRLWAVIVRQLLFYIDQTQVIDQGDGSEHDWSCMYSVLMFPINHSVEAFKAVNEDFIQKIMVDWSELWCKFIELTPLAVTADPNSEVEYISRAILNLFKKSVSSSSPDTFYGAYNLMANILLVLSQKLRYSELGKSSIRQVNSPARPKKKACPLHNVAACVELFELLFMGLIRMGGCPGRLNTAQVLCEAIINIIKGVYHEKMLNHLITEVLSPLTEGFKVSPFIRFNADIGKLFVKVLRSFSLVFEERIGKTHTSEHLQRFEPLFRLILTSSNKEIKQAGRQMWKASFAATKHSISSSLYEVLKDCSLPPASLTDTQDDLEDLHTNPKENVPDNIPGSFLKRSVGLDGSPKLKSLKFDSPKTTRLSLGTPKSKEKKINQVSLLEMKEEDFVKVASPKPARRVLTEHQLEKLKERKEIPALYSDLSQTASQVILPPQFASQHSYEGSSVSETLEANLSKEGNVQEKLISSPKELNFSGLFQSKIKDEKIEKPDSPSVIRRKLPARASRSKATFTENRRYRNKKGTINESEETSKIQGVENSRELQSSELLKDNVSMKKSQLSCKTDAENMLEDISVRKGKKSIEDVNTIQSDDKYLDQEVNAIAQELDLQQIPKSQSISSTMKASMTPKAQARVSSKNAIEHFETRPSSEIMKNVDSPNAQYVPESQRHLENSSVQSTYENKDAVDSHEVHSVPENNEADNSLKAQSMLERKKVAGNFKGQSLSKNKKATVNPKVQTTPESKKDTEVPDVKSASEDLSTTASSKALPKSGKKKVAVSPEVQSSYKSTKLSGCLEVQPTSGSKKLDETPKVVSISNTETCAVNPKGRVRSSLRSSSLQTVLPQESKNNAPLKGAEDKDHSITTVGEEKVGDQSLLHKASDIKDCKVNDGNTNTSKENNGFLSNNIRTYPGKKKDNGAVALKRYSSNESDYTVEDLDEVLRTTSLELQKSLEKSPIDEVQDNQFSPEPNRRKNQTPVRKSLDDVRKSLKGKLGAFKSSSDSAVQELTNKTLSPLRTRRRIPFREVEVSPSVTKDCKIVKQIPEVRLSEGKVETCENGSAVVSDTDSEEAVPSSQENDAPLARSPLKLSARTSREGYMSSPRENTVIDLEERLEKDAVVQGVTRSKRKRISSDDVDSSICNKKQKSKHVENEATFNEDSIVLLDDDANENEKCTKTPPQNKGNERERSKNIRKGSNSSQNTNSQNSCDLFDSNSQQNTPPKVTRSGRKIVAPNRDMPEPMTPPSGGLKRKKSLETTVSGDESPSAKMSPSLLDVTPMESEPSDHAVTPSENKSHSVEKKTTPKSSVTCVGDDVPKVIELETVTKRNVQKKMTDMFSRERRKSVDGEGEVEDLDSSECISNIDEFASKQKEHLSNIEENMSGRKSFKCSPKQKKEASKETLSIDLTVDSKSSSSLEVMTVVTVVPDDKNIDESSKYREKHISSPSKEKILLSPKKKWAQIAQERGEVDTEVSKKVIEMSPEKVDHSGVSELVEQHTTTKKGSSLDSKTATEKCDVISEKSTVIPEDSQRTREETFVESDDSDVEVDVEMVDQEKTGKECAVIQSIDVRDESGTNITENDTKRTNNSVMQAKNINVSVSKEKLIDISDSKENRGDVSTVKDKRTSISDTEENGVVSHTEENRTSISHTEENGTIVSDTEDRRTNFSYNEGKRPIISNNKKERPNISDIEDGRTDISYTKEKRGDVTVTEENRFVISDDDEQRLKISDIKERASANDTEQRINISDADERRTNISISKEKRMVSGTKEKRSDISATYSRSEEPLPKKSEQVKFLPDLSTLNNEHKEGSDDSSENSKKSPEDSGKDDSSSLENGQRVDEELQEVRKKNKKSLKDDFIESNLEMKQCEEETSPEKISLDKFSKTIGTPERQKKFGSVKYAGSRAAMLVACAKQNIKNRGTGEGDSPSKSTVGDAVKNRLGVSPHRKGTSGQRSPGTPPTPSRKRKQCDSENGKPWVKHEPSPGATPSPSILKKPALDDSFGRDSTSPPSKLRRVSFADPPVSDRVEIPPSPKTLKGMRAQKRLDMTKADSPMKATPSLLSQTDESQPEPDSPTNLDCSQPLYPPLVSCNDMVDCVAAQLTSPFLFEGLKVILEERGIQTVGQLCQLSEADINKLPIRTPKITLTLKILKKYEENRLRSKKSTNDMLEDVEAQLSEIFGEDCDDKGNELPSNQMFMEEEDGDELIDNASDVQSGLSNNEVLTMEEGISPLNSSPDDVSCETLNSFCKHLSENPQLLDILAKNLDQDSRQRLLQKILVELPYSAVLDTYFQYLRKRDSSDNR